MPRVNIKFTGPNKENIELASVKLGDKYWGGTNQPTWSTYQNVHHGKQKLTYWTQDGDKIDPEEINVPNIDADFSLTFNADDKGHVTIGLT